MFLNLKKPAQATTNYQYKTKTINENGNIKTYEWDFNKNEWVLVSSSTNNDTATTALEKKPVDNANKVTPVEDEPIAFDSLADVYAFLEKEMQKDKEGQKAFEDWKKEAKEQYETPKCEVLDMDDDEEDDKFIDLGMGVLKDRDFETYTLFGSYEDVPIANSFVDITFNNADDDSDTVGITDTQLLTVLLYRLKGTPVEEPLAEAMAMMTK